MSPPDLSRRVVLVRGSLATLAWWTGCASSTDEGTTTDSDVPSIPTDCTVTPSFTEGPFYVNTADLVRRDLTEGIAGTPFRVRLQIVDVATCQPLADLPVDLWSAHPRGMYSGVDNSLVIADGPDTQGTSYLRGRQVTDAYGIVEFETLYPGWYEVTPPHLHFTAPFDERSSFTWQFFLDDDVSDLIYTTGAAYLDRGTHPVRVEGGFAAFVGDGAVVTPSGDADAVVLDIVVGIDLGGLSEPPEVFGG